MCTSSAIIVAEPDKEAGGLALRQLEQWLSGVGLTGDVLDRCERGGGGDGASALIFACLQLAFCVFTTCLFHCR